MKCPLFAMSYMLKVGAAPTHQANCLKEECAWWGEYRVKIGEVIGCCSLPAIALAISDILNKMPHEAQFRK